MNNIIDTFIYYFQNVKWFLKLRKNYERIDSQLNNIFNYLNLNSIYFQNHDYNNISDNDYKNELKDLDIISDQLNIVDDFFRYIMIILNDMDNQLNYAIKLLKS